MKIVLIGESMTMPSGFGVQMRMLGEGFVGKGHEVYVLGSQAHNAFLPGELPEGLIEWPIVSQGDITALDGAISRIKPDVVLVFWHTQMAARMTRLSSVLFNCPMFFWPPWEGTTLPPGANILFPNVPPDKIVHLSKFARDLWRDTLKADLVIPHGIDLSVFKPSTVSRWKLREKWAERLRFYASKDTLILLCADRNIKHKRWDGMFDLVRKVKEQVGDRQVLLLAHTVKVERGKYVGGYDLPALAKTYGVEKEVVYTEFQWNTGLTREELAELYQVADFRVSCSGGEGFGIQTLECAAVGTPQMLCNHTVNRELLPKGTPFLSEPVYYEHQREALWAIPNIQEMASRIVHLYRSKACKLATQAARRHVQRFAKENVVQQWLSLFENSQHDSDLLYTQRFGGWLDAYTQRGYTEAAGALKRLDENSRILEVGSFTGVFINIALEIGLNIQGIDFDLVALKKASARAQHYMFHRKIKEAWPVADIVIMTDFISRAYASQEKQSGTVETFATKLLANVANVKWLLIRESSFVGWDWPILSDEHLDSILSSQDMIRRYDLEKFARDGWGPNLQHQIWTSDKNSSIMPTNFIGNR